MYVKENITRFLAYIIFVGIFIVPLTKLYSLDEDIISSLDEYSLEDLLNISVTTASGIKQELMEVANTMTVLTREDIKRSGARQIQDLFYRIPGLQIRRYDGHTFGISIRRYPNIYAVTLDMLVMVDGVIMFNPIINGTIWTALPISIDEIERIEIIRGPAGVLYSANAVLGVINIITKSAKDSYNYVSAKGGMGYYQSASSGMSFQPIKNIDLYIRGFYQFDRDDGFRKKGSSKTRDDNIERHVFGFRADYEISDDTKLTALFKRNDHNIENQGISGFSGLLKQHYSETHVAVNFSHKHNEHYDFTANAWYKNSENSYRNINDVRTNSLDFKTQHNLRFELLGNHVLSTGTELLYNWTDVKQGITNDTNDFQRISSVFTQEEYRPVKKIILTAGFRMDDNTNIKHHHAVWQPRFSIMYLPSATQSFRFVLSKMIRQTSFGEKDVYSIIISNPVFPNIPLLTARGSREIQPETHLNAELGYRGLWFDGKLNIDTVAFITKIKNIVIVNIPSASFPTTADFVNNGNLHLAGFEIDAKWKIIENLLLYGDYSFVNVDPDGDFTSKTMDNIKSQTFTNIIGLGGRYTYNNLQIDAYIKYFDHTKEYSLLPALGSDKSFSAFFTTILRIGYEFKIPGTKDTNAELEFVARDFHAKRHFETEREYLVPAQIWGGIKIKF